MTIENKPCVFCLMGPTATGKTQLAMEWAEQYNGHIVSVDSAMVYRGMNIGTAKPSSEELECIPHELIDICDPVTPYSVGNFCRDANLAIQKILDAGKTPLLVGGTINYFYRLQYGVAKLPEADQDIRQCINQNAERYGWAAMHSKLLEIDPLSAGRIHPNDAQRIQRALEVYELTGKPLSDYHIAKPDRSESQYRFINVALWPEDRQQLHQRIEQRYNTMLDLGLLDEVSALMSRGDLDLSLPSMRSVGYRQAWQYLQGEIDKESLNQSIVAATRQLAKRQLTWLRRWQDKKLVDIDKGQLYRQLAEYFNIYR